MAPLAIAPLVGAALAGTTAGGLAVASVGIGLLGAGISAYGALKQGKSANAAAEFQAQQEENAAKTSIANAKMQQEQSEAEAIRMGHQRDRSIGAQFAAASASGLTVSGSVIDVARDSAAQVEEDMAMVRYQGSVGGWNYSEQAKTLVGQAGMTRSTGKNAYRAAKWSAAGTAIKGIGNAAMSMYGFYSTASKLPVTLSGTYGKQLNKAIFVK